MTQELQPPITIWRAIAAYIAAIVAGGLACAAITLVNWLRDNGYEPARDQHLFAGLFLLSFLFAVTVALVALAPVLVPSYVLCVMAIRKWAIRSRVAFVAIGTVFSTVGWFGVAVYRCWGVTCSSTPWTAISHASLETVIELVVIGAASGLAGRSTLLRASTETSVRTR